MHLPKLILWLCISVALMGCSTGPFLRPVASGGTYQTVNPACPGAAQVVEFSPKNQYWVLLRVYATLPGDAYESVGTELRIHFWLRYAKPASNGIFQNREEREATVKLIQEKGDLDYIITASKPTVIVVLPDSSRKEIQIPAFAKPFNLKNDRTSWFDHGVQISPMRLNKFTVILPDVFANGEKLQVPPIHFEIGEERYTPVINC